MPKGIKGSKIPHEERLRRRRESYRNKKRQKYISVEEYQKWLRKRADDFNKWYKENGGKAIL